MGFWAPKHVGFHTRCQLWRAPEGDSRRGWDPVLGKEIYAMEHRWALPPPPGAVVHSIVAPPLSGLRGAQAGGNPSPAHSALGPVPLALGLGPGTSAAKAMGFDPICFTHPEASKPVPAAILAPAAILKLGICS